jgi:hypothetical protein
MGGQTMFYMLPEDMGRFLSFLQERDPIVVTQRSADSAKVEALIDPSVEQQVMTIWNKNLLDSLESLRGNWSRIQDEDITALTIHCRRSSCHQVRGLNGRERPP